MYVVFHWKRRAEALLKCTHKMFYRELRIKMIPSDRQADLSLRLANIQVRKYIIMLRL